MQNKFRRLRLCGRIALFFFIGLACVLLFIQQEPWFKTLVQEQTEQALSESFGSPVSCSVDTVDLFTGTIIIKHVHVADDTGTWSLTGDTMRMKFSLLDILIKQVITARFTLSGMSLYSHLINGDLAIVEPIERFLNTPSVIPFDVPLVTFKQVQISIYEPLTQSTATALLSADLSLTIDTAHMVIQAQQGMIAMQDVPRLTNIEGPLILDFKESAQGLVTEGQMNFTAIASDLQASAQSLLIQGDYKQDKGTVTVRSYDNTCWAQLADIKFHTGFSAKYTSQFTLSSFLAETKGSFSLSGAIEYTEEKILANVSCISEGISFLSDCRAIDLSLFSQQDTYHAVMQMNKEPLMHCTITPEKDGYVVNSALVKEVTASEVILKQILAQAHIRRADDFEGSINGLYSYKGKAPMPCTLQIHSTGAALAVHGACAKLSLDCSYVFDQKLFGLTIQNKEKSVATIQLDILKKTFQSTVSVASLIALLKSLTHQDILGEGVLRIDGSYDEHLLQSTICMPEGTIKIPHIYNTVTKFESRIAYDIIHRYATVHSLDAVLHNGSISMQDARCYFDAAYRPLFAQGTLHFHDCLANWKRLFFGRFSGYASLNYYDKQALLKGLVFIDRSYFKGNPLSVDIQKDIMMDTMQSLIPRLSTPQIATSLDFTIQTRSPLEVKTPFLKTHLTADVSIEGAIDKPIFSGGMELHEGVVYLPYKPLYITLAKIQFNPHQPDDPSIEIIAKNIIKKYAVQMEVTGSLQVPHVTLTSSPHLSEGQLLTLLLAGSEDGSLIGVMPHMFMQGLELVLFSNADDASTWLTSLKNITKPLGNIRINPTISRAENKTRGGIEIDLNDTLRASITNNLDLSDETAVELEYALSDDTTVRGTRDDKGNISGELEMRWKF